MFIYTCIYIHIYMFTYTCKTCIMYKHTYTCMIYIRMACLHVLNA